MVKRDKVSRPLVLCWAKRWPRGGLHVFADQDYESRIRGGHNFFRVRVKDQEVNAQSEKLDILIALDKETVERHRGELKENGIIILDRQALNLVPGPSPGQGMETQNPALVDVPLEKLAVDVAANKIMSNSVAVGAVLGLIGYDFNILEDVLRWHFAKNTEKVKEDNVKAAGPDMILRPNIFRRPSVKRSPLRKTVNACSSMAVMLYLWGLWRPGVNSFQLIR